jgi:hypothetical protein
VPRGLPERAARIAPAAYALNGFRGLVGCAGPRRQDGQEGGDLLWGGVASDQAQGRSWGSWIGHSGMFPCFLGGRVSRLVRSARKAFATYDRVYDGGMTEST